MRTIPGGHLLAPAVAALLALGAAIPAGAGAGLPRLGDLQAGPYQVTLFNDSPSLVAGRNVLTIEAPAEVAAGIELEMVGPGGESRSVSLRRVRMLGQPASSHGAGSTDGHGDGHDADAGTPAPAPRDSHSGGHSHGAPAPTPTAGSAGHAAGHASGDHGAAGEVAQTGEATPAAEPVLLRGSVSLPTKGAWLVRVTVVGPDGNVHRSDAMAIAATGGGPNRWYLAVTGAVMSLAMGVGVVGRRSRAAGSDRRR